MTHVKALQAGNSSQGTSEPITPGQKFTLFLWWVGGLASISFVKKILFFIFAAFFYLICMDT